MRRKFILGTMIVALLLAAFCCDYLFQNFYYSYFEKMKLPDNKNLESLVEQFGEPQEVVSSDDTTSVVFNGFTVYYSIAGTFLRVEVWDSQYEFGPFYARVHVGSTEETVNRLIHLKKHKIKDLKDNQKGYVIGKEVAFGEWVIFEFCDGIVDKIYITDGF